MAAKAARGLGKGLDSLIPAAAPKVNSDKAVEKTENSVQETLVKITKVEPNREQPRKNFDEEPYRNWQNPSSSLVFYSRFWCRTGRHIMRS